ncbi:MAG: signal peptide peptidase SppA [Candidatus Marinimicrobia bacterium]|nr:signal peptide peptidase SppA [Candidatus Neomarinimicrobiota bacterium]
MKNRYQNFIIILLVLVSMGFTQSGVTYWRGMSVATSDNLDAISLNPAGLGVDRGFQSGFHVVDSEDDDMLYHSAFRIGGLGFSLYGNGDVHYKIGLGSELGKNTYLGYVWDDSKISQLGLISRPIHYVSFGLTYGWDKNTDISNSRLGIAIRPLGHRITIGADLIIPDMDEVKNIDKLNDFSDIAGFLEIQPLDGLYFSASSMGSNDFTVQVGLDFGTGAVYSSQSQRGANSTTITEFGLISHSQVQNTLVKMKPVKPEVYYRMTLEDYMIEEKPFHSFSFNFNPFQKSVHGTQLRAWLLKMDEITNDPSVAGLIIDLKFVSAGFGKLSEMRNALLKFKESGKKIIVYTSGMSNSNYYLLSLADEIYLPELGEIDLRGLMIEISFLKGLLDTLDIVAEVEQISPYKTAMDPLIRKNMSPEMRENYGMVFDDIYNQFVEAIAAGRSWSTEKTIEVINNGPYGSPEALKAGLIDGLKYPDEFEEYIKKIDDVDVKIKPFHTVGNEENYVHEWSTEDKPKIALIYAVGGIQSGRSKPGSGGSTIMGNQTISEAIVAAREDNSVKAIVLRIDSGGGSALASDMMWREVMKTTETDSGKTKPFIASMSDVAASGGYYIACQADTIVADPGTITGSIGVISGRINFSGLLEKIGINTERIKFGEHSDFYSGTKRWNDEERKIIRDAIVDVYGTFLSRVAHGREDLDSLQVNEIGVGRIWSGRQAKENHLIDEIGGLDRAIEIAKAAAGLEDQEVEIVEYPNFKQKFSMLKSNFMGAELLDILPPELAKELEVLQIIPMLDEDQYLFLMPYKITIQ